MSHHRWTEKTCLALDEAVCPLILRFKQLVDKIILRERQLVRLLRLREHVRGAVDDSEPHRRRRHPASLALRRRLNQEKAIVVTLLHFHHLFLGKADEPRLRRRNATGAHAIRSIAICSGQAKMLQSGQISRSKIFHEPCWW